MPRQTSDSELGHALTWADGAQAEFAWGRESREALALGDELWVPVPPGWIEMVAHPDEEAAMRWFSHLLDTTPGLDSSDRRALAGTFADARAALPPVPLDAAGVLVTTYRDRPTLWQLSLSLVAGPASGDVDLMAVVQRFVASPAGAVAVATDDLVETFRTQDGRPGVAVHTQADVGPRSDVGTSVPDAGAPLGVVHAAVRMDRAEDDDRDRVLVVTGLAPTVEERLPMAIVAAQLTLGARLRDAEARPLPGRVHLDATGRERHLSDEED